MRQLISEPSEVLDALAADYGRTFQIRMGPLSMLVIGDRACMADVLGTDLDRYRWGRVFSNLKIVTGKTSMIVSDGEAHDRRRRLAQPAFVRRRLYHWSGAILAAADRTIDGLPQEGVIDLLPILRSMVRRMVLRVLFGEEMASRSDEVGDVLEPALMYASQPLLRQIPHPFPFTYRARTKAARRHVDALIDAELKARRAAPVADRSDVLDALLARSGNGFTDEEIRDQMVSLIAAGYDTTSAALSWAVLRSALEPEIWMRLRTEADSDDETRPFAEAVVHESLRLHPPGLIAPRQLVRRATIGPYHVRKGTIVLWSPHLLGRDPESWPEPLQFRPERFLSGKGPPEYAWVPFGHGPRMCIGAALAQMDMTLALSRLAQRVDLEAVSDSVPAPVGMVTSRPSSGVLVRVGSVRAVS